MRLRDQRRGKESLAGAEEEVVGVGGEVNVEAEGNKLPSGKESIGEKDEIPIIRYTKSVYAANDDEA